MEWQPSESDWINTDGTRPYDFYDRSNIVMLRGRYGDVYGPVPIDLIVEAAWSGHMGNASHDITGFALVPENASDPGIPIYRTEPGGLLDTENRDIVIVLKGDQADNRALD